MSGSRSKSIALHQAACRVIPGGVNSPVRAFRSVGGTPVYFASGSGSRVEDVDGSVYVDFCQSWGPLILGHACPAVVEAVREAAGRGLSFGACHAAEAEIAALVLEAFPEFGMVRMVSSGTEAVMTALRLARGATGRDVVVKFEGGYHGHADAMLVKAGSGLVTQGIASSAGVPPAVADSTAVACFDDEQGLARLFEEDRGKRIAAVIVEPLPANNGLLMQRPEFLARIRQLTRQHGALLIFDEVISGFRFRFGGFCHQLGIIPDLVTLGKILGGGMPAGAVVGPEALLSLLAPTGPVYQAGTLSGNPVAIAAGLATLRTLRDQPPYDLLERLGRVFVQELCAGGDRGLQAAVCGSVVWPYLDASALPRRPDAIAPAAVRRFNALHGPMLQRGHYLPPSAHEVMFLSAAHAEQEVRACAADMRRLSREVAAREESGTP